MYCNEIPIFMYFGPNIQPCGTPIYRKDLINSNLVVLECIMFSNSTLKEFISGQINYLHE